MKSLLFLLLFFVHSIVCPESILTVRDTKDLLQRAQELFAFNEVRVKIRDYISDVKNLAGSFANMSWPEYYLAIKKLEDSRSDDVRELFTIVGILTQVYPSLSKEEQKAVLDCIWAVQNI